MSKLVIALSATLTGILLFGYNYQNTPKYAAEEIRKINKDIISSVYSLEKARRAKYANATIDESEDKIAPIIEIVYPEEFKHGDTIETDKVELKFSDNVKVVKARMNNLTIPTDTVKITTTGTYNIEIEDEAKNKTRLVFTITQEVKKTEETEKAEEQKKAQEEAERKARVAAEKKGREEAERKARAAERQKAREEAEKQVEKQVQEQKAREEAEKQAQEQKVREEATRKAQEEAEKKAREEAEKEKNEQENAGQTGNERNPNEEGTSEIELETGEAGTL